MKAKQPAREVLDVNLPELEALLERLRQESLDEESYQKLQSLLKAFRYLVEQIGDKDATISRLQALLMKPSTEKTSKVLERAGIKVPPQNHPPPTAKAPPKPGHGRNGAAARALQLFEFSTFPQAGISLRNERRNPDRHAKESSGLCASCSRG